MYEKHESEERMCSGCLLVSSPLSKCESAKLKRVNAHTKLLTRIELNYSGGGGGGGDHHLIQPKF
ncbi:hypothetical protein TYRP_008776 [Tyrophagus putrescentiae]|nr:hypothetical protein TYRP_008776 [Tyrophagus putrescentiae]